MAYDCTNVKSQSYTYFYTPSTTYFLPTNMFPEDSRNMQKHRNNTKYIIFHLSVIRRDEYVCST